MVSTEGIVRGNRRVTLAVVAITLFGLLARLVFLGERIAHWDEARVGYWILNYLETGTFEYQPIIHGPFLQQVNRPIFAVFGANDFTMRVVVAVLGAALPLVALLLRHRLRNEETVALALFFAVNPVLLYYSRFMRSDIPLAVFMLFALGFFIRALDTRKFRYVHLGTLSLALGFTTKENVLIYLVTWVGALVLLADHRLFLERGIPDRWRDRLDFSPRNTVQSALGRVRSGRAALTPNGGWTVRRLRRWIPHTLLAFFEFFVIIVYFYAPRTDGEQPGFNTLLAEPATLPAVVEEATIGSWNAFYSLWVGGGHQDHAYLPFLADYLETLALAAGALCVLAVVGFIVDRYSGGRPRDLVAFCFYWGFVSILGYPVITDIQAAWTTVHAIVPLAIPAAVGVGLLYRRGQRALVVDDKIAAGAVAVIFLIIIGQVTFVAVNTVYLHPQSEDNVLVQYAQPIDDIRPTIQDMAALSAQNEGTDVLIYGEYFVAETPGSRKPFCTGEKWFNLLPLPWYMNAHNMNVSCARTNATFENKTNESAPPVVIGLTADREYLAAHLEGYDQRIYVMRTQDTQKTNTTFFVDESRLTQNASGTQSSFASQPRLSLHRGVTPRNGMHGAFDSSASQSLSARVENRLQ